jgi:hypothetical protein
VSGVTSSASTAVFISNDGQMGTVQSSRRYKKDIQDISAATVDKLDLMDVKTFRYATDPPDAPLQYGMIAEDMQAIDTNLVHYDELGQPKTIYYHQLVPMLVAYVQDLRCEIDELKNLLSAKSNV